MKHTLTKSENVLPNDYPMFPGYLYIVDMKFTKNDLGETTVGEYKSRNGCNEIRRCDIFNHPNAKLGDELVHPD